MSRSLSIRHKMLLAFLCSLLLGLLLSHQALQATEVPYAVAQGTSAPVTPTVPSEFLTAQVEGQLTDYLVNPFSLGRYDILIHPSEVALTLSEHPRINEQTLLIYEQTFTVTNLFDVPARDLELRISLLPGNLPGYQVVFEERIWPTVSEIIENSDGSRFAVIMCSSLLPGESLLITISYNLVNTSWETDKNRLVLYNDPPRDPKALAALLPDRLIESDHPEIMAMARHIIGSEQNPYRKAEMLYSWVNLNLVYDEDPLYAHLGAYSALITRRGVCTEYASLFVALLRASGIPARLVGGYLMLPTRNPNLASHYDTSLQAHTWAEFYLEGFGWIPSEPTYQLFESDVRFTSLKYFAALPHWGHIVTSSGIHSDIVYGSQFDISYSGFRDMLRGEVTASFRIGQRLMSDEIKVFLFDYDHRVNFGELQPLLLPEGIIVLPLRRIFEILGAEVMWDEEMRSITASYLGNTIALQIASPILRINDFEQEMSVAPFIDPQSDKAYVPLRAVSEGLGASVTWDQMWRRVLIIPLT